MRSTESRQTPLTSTGANEVSRNAILRLGAQEEGTFRNYIVRADGEIHDAVFYSIIESEWPSVRTRLQEMLARRYDREA